MVFLLFAASPQQALITFGGTLSILYHVYFYELY